MSLRKIAGLLAAGGITVGLVGSGVAAQFADQVTATQHFNVGTFSCIITDGGGGTVSADQKSVEFTSPLIMSSAAGTAPFNFTVQNSGQINAQLTVSEAPALSSPWSYMPITPGASFPLAAGASQVIGVGVKWTELSQSDTGTHGTVTYTVNCGEATVGGTVIFDNHPATLPSSIPSYGVESSYFNEAGAGVTFVGTARKASTATVTMSSWACQSGSWTVAFGSAGTCVTTPGSTYNVPITFKIYAVGTGNSVGALLATKTQTFAIPYRPSSIAGGDGKTWNGTSHGLATNITFTFAGETLNNTAIFGIAYNTSTNGYSPEGVGTHPEDSLNIGVYPETVGNGSSTASAPIVGSWLPDGLSAYISPQLPTPGAFAGPVTTFSSDWPPFGGNLPAVQITATN